MNVGATIRNLREARNVTQEYMAAKLNIGVTAYGNIERNDVKRLTVARVAEIARILNVHFLEIFGFKDKDLLGAGGKQGGVPFNEINMQAVLQYFRRDKELMLELLGVLRDMCEQMGQGIQEHTKILQKVVAIQQDIQREMLARRS